jgi:type IV pilus assembly protein PilA
MIQRITDRLHREEKGFTLIELMVVVLIIAILIAIAIPTFLGARRRAQDRAAQSSLRNTVTAAKAVFTDNEDYSAATVAALTQGEPSLSFVDGSTTDSTESTMVAIDSEAVNSSTKDNRFFAAAQSDSGICWYVQDIAGPVGTTNAGTTWARQDQGTGACSAADAPAYNSANWKKTASAAVDF